MLAAFLRDVRDICGGGFVHFPGNSQQHNYFLRRGGVGVGDDTADMQAATQGAQGECGRGRGCRRGRQRCESVAVVNIFSTEPRPPPLDL